MHYLGQHFLKNESAIKKIVDALELKSGDTVVEIGPGHGELTEKLLALSFKLLEKNGSPQVKIIAIEKDPGLVNDLHKRFPKKNMEIIEGDALKIIPRIIRTYKLKAISYKLVGNIPYYITGKLLRIISNLKEKPEICVFTIQKEVTERIASRPPRMNRLAAMVQFWAEPKIVMSIGKNNFDPPPAVDSAIIKLKRKPEKERAWRAYEKAAKLLFTQPRKTILNNILPKRNQKTKEGIEEKLKKAGINPLDRPQNLSVEDIKKISALIAHL